MTQLKKICVFCGSSNGNRGEYAYAAESLAQLLASRGITLVYGGARRGLMGIIADTMLARGGHVIGVVPRSLVEYEVAHTGLSELHVVDSMHERKAKMFEISEAFIALPGGVGTIDETFEIVSWAVLGIHRKPCGLLNVENYFQKLEVFLDHAKVEGFLSAEHRNILLSAETPEELLGKLEAYVAPQPRWTPTPAQGEALIAADPKLPADKELL